MAATVMAAGSSFFAEDSLISAPLYGEVKIIQYEVPEKPALEGLEEKWTARWEAEGTYRFDRSRPRDEVYAIDTPPPTVSGSLHVGHVFSFTHTDIVARFQRMRGKAVFYPMGWDDNGLPTERRVQNYFGVRCDPSLPYDPDFEAPATPAKHPIAVSRPNFIELCVRLTHEDEKAFEHLWRYLGLSIDWSMTYATIAKPAQRVSQMMFLRLLRARPRVSARGAHAVGCRFQDGRRAGRARGSRAAWRVSSRALPQAGRRHASRSRRRVPSCSRRASRSSRTRTMRVTSRCLAPRSSRRCLARACR